MFNEVEDGTAKYSYTSRFAGSYISEIRGIARTLQWRGPSERATARAELRDVEGAESKIEKRQNFLTI